MLQVPFFICRYLLLNIQVPFSTRQQAIHGTVLFTPDLLTPHTAFTSLPAAVPVFWNVSTHFFYPCEHSVVASSTRCHLNRRKLNTYRETRPPSWENGTWQVPSQLSHSAQGLVQSGHKKIHYTEKRYFLGNDKYVFWFSVNWVHLQSSLHCSIDCLFYIDGVGLLAITLISYMISHVICVCLFYL